MGVRTSRGGGGREQVGGCGVEGREVVVPSQTGAAVFCAVYQLEGQLQHWLQQATFLDGQCVRLEPAQSAKEPHSQGVHLQGGLWGWVA